LIRFGPFNDSEKIAKAMKIISITLITALTKGKAKQKKSEFVK
jgi:hypothetical protein